VKNPNATPFSEIASTLPVDVGDIVAVDLDAQKGSSGWVPLEAVGEVQTRLDQCNAERSGFLATLKKIKSMLVRDKSIPDDFDSEFPS
jgi:hypothetical protein